jgi:hypothetical protein
MCVEERKGRALSKRKNPEKASPGLTFIGRLYHYVKWAVVALSLAVLGYGIIEIPVGPTKIIVIIGAPVIAELAILDLIRYIAIFIKHASPFRGFICSIFGILFGGILFTVSVSQLTGIVVIVLSALLLVYKALNGYRDKSLGVKRQDPIVTGSMTVLLAGILVFEMGSFNVFVTLLICSLVMFLYRSPASDMAITIVTACVLAALYGQVSYGITVFAVGVISVVLGVFLSHHGFTSGIIKGFSTFRGLSSAFFVLAIGICLSVIYVSALLVGLIVTGAGVALAVYSIWKYHLTQDLGLRAHDPVITVTVVLFLSGVLALVLGALSIFGFLFCTSLVMILYRRPMFLIIVVLVAAIFLSGLFINIIYPIGIIVVGVFAVAIGMIAKKIESDRIARAVRAKKI